MNNNYKNISTTHYHLINTWDLVEIAKQLKLDEKRRHQNLKKIPKHRVSHEDDYLI